MARVGPVGLERPRIYERRSLKTMSQLTDFFKEDDERRRKRLEAAQGWITEKLGQVKTKAEVTVDQVKEYFTSGKVKEDLPKLPGKAMDTAQAFFKGGAAALPLPSP